MTRQRSQRKPYSSRLEDDADAAFQQALRISNATTWITTLTAVCATYIITVKLGAVSGGVMITMIAVGTLYHCLIAGIWFVFGLVSVARRHSGQCTRGNGR